MSESDTSITEIDNPGIKGGSMPFDDDIFGESLNDASLLSAVETIEASQASSEYLVTGANGTSGFKKVHMDMMDCKDHADSQSGSVALTNPAALPTSSRDPNHGLQPRPSRKHAAASGPFITAAALLKQEQVQVGNMEGNATPTAPIFHPQSFPLSPKRQRSGPKFKPQSNKLDKYFTKTESPTKSPNTTPTKTFSSSQGCSTSTAKVTPPRMCSSSQGAPPKTTPPLPRSPSFLYSPIKQIGDSQLYVSVPNASLGCSAGQPNKETGAIPKSLFNGEPSGDTGAGQPNDSGPASSDCTIVYSQTSYPSTNSTTSVFRDKYGLLGNGHNLPPDDPSGNKSGVHINDFPYEILENILCRLPISDLYLHVNRVCHRWNDIISSDKVFMHFSTSLARRKWPAPFAMIHVYC